MAMLAEEENTLFIGQNVYYDGQSASHTFDGVPMERRIEMPVIEDFQLGFCIGLSLQGYLPLCFYPRMDFLILAMNQLVNHLDKIPMMGGFRPKVIIRVGVGSTKPLDVGPQHCQDHTEALRRMLKTVAVIDIMEEGDIMPAYRFALNHDASTIVVERMDRYHA